MLDDLKVKVVADFTEYKKQMQDLEVTSVQAFNKVSNSAINTGKTISSSLGNNTTTVKDNSKAVLTLEQAYDKLATNGKRSIYELTENMRALKEASINENNTQKLQEYNNRIFDLKTQIKQLSTDTGALSTVSTNSFNQLAAGGQKAFSALRTVANILPGIGIAGLLAFAIEPITNYISSLTGITEETKRISEQQDEYRKGLSSIISDLSKEAGNVAVLVKALESETTTKKEKLEIIERLKKISPEYFGQLNLEKNLVDNLSKAYSNYIENLKNKFKAQAFDKQIQSLFDKKIDLEIQLDKTSSVVLDKELNAQITRFQGRFEQLGGLKRLQDALNKSAFDQTAEDKKIIEANNQLNSLYQKNKSELLNENKITKEIAVINNEINGLLERRIKTGNLDLEGTKAAKEKIKNEKTYLDIIEQLRKELRGIAAENKSGFFNPIQFDEAQLAAYKKAIKGLGEVTAPVNVVSGISAEAAIIQADLYHRKLIEEFSKLAKPKLEIELVTTNKDLSNIADEALVKDGIRKIKTYLEELPDIMNVVENKLRKKFGEAFNLEEFFKSAKTNPSVYVEKIKEVYSVIQGTVEEEQLKLTALVQQSLTTLFTGFGEGISASILNGSDLGQQLFGTLFQVLGNGIKQLGEYLITTSTLLKNLKLLFGVGNFTGSIVIGIALVALGSLMANAGSGLKFADGGYVSGPGTSKSDSINARLSNGEYVINASTVNKFGRNFFDNVNAGKMPMGIAGVANRVEVLANNIEIAGDKLLIIFNRASAKNSRQS